GGMPTEFAVTEPILKTYTFTAEQFLAEKNILDREIALKNSWFYAPSKENPQGDASPAVDLIAMLSAIWELQQKKKKIQVIQVGDLYELWVNREYLYRDWPIDEAGVGSGFALSIIRDYGSAVKGFRGQPDSYQYRFDGDWYEPEGKRIKYVSDIEKGIRGSRCYIFNHWPERNLVDRYSVGQDIVEYHKELNSEIEQQERLYYTKGTKYHDWIEARNKLRSLLRKRKRLNSTVDRIPRVRELVKERIDNVKAFVLPNPDKWASDVLTRVSGNVLGEEKFKTYWRKDPLGKYECLWNKLALDLLSKVDCQMIYGNHDSYRGDKLINTKLGKYEKANMWHSEPGLWAEHGHRWDQYNRDGVVFGAGVTNLVYYYYRPYIESLNKLKSKLLPQFYTEIFPGMVTWYLLANYGDREKWFGSSVKPFGICAIGHTHTPNLLRVRFRL
ncbi:MAG: hypothetical protein ACK2TV_08540, partial [Anaerolineales bacterium]